MEKNIIGMKQLLLLAVIHLLILHQYKKDKEALAPKKNNKLQKTDVAPGKHDYLFRDITNNTTDSLFSPQSEFVRPNYVSYSFTAMTYK